MDYFGVKLIPDCATFRLIDRNGIAVIREAIDFAEEDSCGLRSRQAGDGALGRNDYNHISMRTRSNRSHCQEQKLQAVAENFEWFHVVHRA